MIVLMARIIVVAALAWAAMTPVPALAQSADWPARPVRLVVPYAPGGNIDVATRVIAERLQALLGQSVIVDNKPGAGGLIASQFVAKSPSDGYTFFVGANGPLLFMPVITGQAGFDWRQDFAAVGALAFTPLVLQVRPALGVDDVPGFLALAGRKDLNMGSGGAGSTNHLVSELVQSLAGVKWTTIHYKGNAPVIIALQSGEVDFDFEQVSDAMPLIKDKRMRPLAVTSRDRFSLLPDVPTLDESGFKGFEAVTWTGLFAPAKTPRAIIDRFNAVLQDALRDPAVQKRFISLGSEAKPMNPEAFADYVAKENTKWLPLIRKANIKPE